MQTARFQWFILISFMIHVLLLPLFRLLPIHELKPFPPLELGLLTTPSSPQPETSIQPGRTGQPTVRATPRRGSTRTKPLTPPARGESPSSTRESSSSAEGSAIAPGGTGSGTGPIAPGSEGIAIGSGESPSGTGGAGSTPGGAPTGTKKGLPGPVGTSAGTKKGSGESEIDDFSGIEIPPYVIDAAGFRSRFDDGGIYPEIDSYVLFGGEKNIEVSVPGDAVCVEGDQLLTKERITIAEIKTDHSKCRIVELGDRIPPKEICPPDATTRVVHLNHYASSPLVYSVRNCLEYNRSHCYDAVFGDTEREVCRVDFRYEGKWAEGTIFDYKCTKSEARTYRHPLQYQIRWIMEFHTIDERLIKRQVYRETRTVERCS
jgi:hypothetical protein